MTGLLPFWRQASSLKTGRAQSNEKSARLRQVATDFFDPDDGRIFYKFSTRAKRISLRVHPSDRQVTVIVPGERALPKAQKFVREKMDWINVQLEGLPQPQPFYDGAPILFEGALYEVVIPSPRGRAKIDRDNRQMIIPASEDTLSGRGHRLLKREARAALEASTQIYADALGKSVAKISIRDSRTRWGSCISRSGEGYISYSWRLICAPPFVLDYVCAHECAHMIHPDHSANFWDLTHEIFPETKAAKAWLKVNGAQLHAVGADV